MYAMSFVARVIKLTGLPGGQEEDLFYQDIIEAERDLLMFLGSGLMGQIGQFRSVAVFETDITLISEGRHLKNS
jgi:hypothetical protein